MVSLNIEKISSPVETVFMDYVLSVLTGMGEATQVQMLLIEIDPE